MDGLVTVANSVEQFKNPADLANAWQGADEKAHADGSTRKFSQQGDVEQVEKQALGLLQSDDIAKRSSGVVMLGSISTVCSSAQFIERCRSWIQPLMSTLGKCGAVAQAGIAQLLCQLVHRASEFISVTGCIAPFMPTIVDRLVRSTPEWRVDALTCLKTCMQCYPALCLSTKEKIIHALLPLLDIGEESTQEIVAQCMATVPCIGGDGGNAATKHTEVWLQWCNMLLATLNDTLDKLVSPIEQVQTPLIGVPSGNGSGVAEPPDKLPLEEPTESEPNRTAVLLTRCQSLCCCLKYLLQTAYPVAVSFPLQGILAVSCRILALSIQQLVTHPSLECVLMFSALPAFYSSAVDLLTAITCSCKQFLLPQRWLIDQLLLQAFGWTGADSANHTTPYSCVRICLYKLLTAWVWVIGGGVDQGSAMHFIKHILNDAKPVRKEDKIRLLKQANQERQSGEATSVDPRDVDIAANPELTLSALEALSALLMAAGSVLSAECHEAIQLFLIPVILEINAAHRPSSGLPPPKGWWTAGNAPAPYGRADCRKELYNTLLSCALTDDHLRAPPLHHAIQLFLEGMRDPNMEVSRLCYRAMCVCKLMTHPRLPLSVAASGVPASAAGSGQPETPASARLAMQRSIAVQQKDLQEQIRKNFSSQESSMASNRPLAPQPPVVVDLAQAEASTIHYRRMKNRKGSAASSCSPCDDPSVIFASSATSASTTAVDSSSAEPMSSTTKLRAQVTEEAAESAEGSAVTSPTKKPSKRKSGEAEEDAVQQQPQGKLPDVQPPAKRLREPTPEPATARSASSPVAKKVDKPASEETGEVSGMLCAFVDSGPDSGADSDATPAAAGT